MTYAILAGNERQLVMPAKAGIRNGRPKTSWIPGALHAGDAASRAGKAGNDSRRGETGVTRNRKAEPKNREKPREKPAQKNRGQTPVSARRFPHEDRKRCLDAGMNDHIGKPVAADVLYETLLRWLRKPAA